MPYTILLLMNATPAWLSLTRDERSAFFDATIAPIIKRVENTTNVRLFDSEYFHARVSDFMMVTTHTLDDYKLLVELLRDTKIYGKPYFEIIDIIVGQENAFQEFNNILKEGR